LRGSFVVTKGLDKCLFVYPREEWENIEGRLKELPFTKSDARSFARMFFAGAAECESDKQGRVTIPPALREYAGIIKDAVVLGVANRLEIWGAEQWSLYSEQALDNYEKIAEELDSIF
ncbi:MAG: division/cell wall cluster transcriptional repressor MraZ, partial [bacterium]|nr:division/cell wall cluster transcriptional repressor MraZ [bacterium]